MFYIKRVICYNDKSIVELYFGVKKRGRGKMKRKAAAIAVAVSLIMCFSACGKGSSEAEQKEKKPPKNVEAEQKIDETEADESGEVISITGDQEAEEAEEKVAVGEKVHLDTILAYMDEPDHSTVRAIHRTDEDIFEIISDPKDSGYYTSVDKGFQLGYKEAEFTQTRMYAACHEFMMDPEKDELVIFSTNDVYNKFDLLGDMDYAVPLLFYADGTFQSEDNTRVFGQSLLTQNGTDIDSNHTKDLKINGKPVEELVSDPSVYIKGYNQWQDGETELGYILTGSPDPITLSSALGTKLTEVQVSPGLMFYNTSWEKLELNYEITQDGYAVFDLRSWIDSIGGTAEAVRQYGPWNGGSVGRLCDGWALIGFTS